MTDRELLELAAKAAGYKYDWVLESPQMITRFGYFVNITGLGSQFIGWNPLSDDSEAFRLAMDLGISIKFDEWNKQALASTIDFICYEEAKTVDRYKAARRAIVRAAAEIGKSMK